MTETYLVNLLDLVKQIPAGANIPISYANHARVIGAGNELFLDFLLVSPSFRSEEPEVHIIHRIILPAAQAQSLANAIQQVASQIQSIQQTQADIAEKAVIPAVLVTPDPTIVSDEPTETTE